ncbi:MAG TPA: M20 family metallopeptidase [Propionibacteriaceae bacterium]|nr:M20 family metallopeptidase [Propionibacteriaceae bacterium]
MSDPRNNPSILLAPMRERFGNVLDRIEELVNIDSGSFTAEGVNRVADLCQTRFEAAGWEVERQRHRPDRDWVGQPVGDLLVGRRTGRRPVAEGGRRLLLLAHMDTVFDDGTAAARPFRARDSRGYGPGVTDDKAGVVCGLEAVDVLCNLTGFEDFAAITLVCSPDEEIGSPFSRPLITALASEHDLAVGLEAARTNGALVSARKGISAFTIEVEGKAVHAGVRPAEGVNAVLEAAHKAVALHALNGRWPEVTCNVGVLQGGRRTNVVADRAVMQVEVRAATTAAFGEAMDEVARIVATTTVPGARARLLPAHRHPPMERTPAVAALVAVAQGVARDLGFEVGEAATGGAGDANTTAAAGLPTIDGLAPVGGEAHGPNEWLDLDSIVPRTALLAGLLARLGSRISTAKDVR